MNNIDVALILQNYSLSTLRHSHNNIVVLQDGFPNNNHVNHNCRLGNTQHMPGNLHTSSCFILKTVSKVDIIIPISQIKPDSFSQFKYFVLCHITNK